MDSPNTLNVLLTMPFSAAQIDKISAVSSRIVVTQREARSPEDIADVIGATDVLYTSSFGRDRWGAGKPPVREQ
jgi:hypothetical protein